MRRGAGGIGRQIAALAAALLVVGIAAALCGAGAAATRPSTLRARDQALAQRENAAALELYALESQVARAQSALGRLQARAATLAHRRELTRRRAAAIHGSLESARRRLAKTLRSLYTQGQPDPVAILLGAGSIDEAVDGIDGLRRAVQANRRLVADLRAKEVRARAIDARLRARTRDLAVARASAGLALGRLQQAALSKRSRLASLRSQRDLTRRQITRLDAVARQAQRRSVRLDAAARRAARSKPRPEAAVTPAVPTALHTAGSGTRTMVVDAVAYHLGGKTASGLPVGVGVVAVDPTVIPLGTRMFIPGYGRGVAADVGSAVKGRIIDLWMPTRAQALAWGRRTVTITVYG